MAPVIVDASSSLNGIVNRPFILFHGGILCQRVPRLLSRHGTDDAEEGSRSERRHYNRSMHIPHHQLSPVALRAIVEEFVTRDGTDHTAVDTRIDLVLRQLDSGRVVLHFDVETETCNILPVDWQAPR